VTPAQPPPLMKPLVPPVLCGAQIIEEDTIHPAILPPVEDGSDGDATPGIVTRNEVAIAGVPLLRDEEAVLGALAHGDVAEGRIVGAVDGIETEPRFPSPVPHHSFDMNAGDRVRGIRPAGGGGH